MMIYNVPYHQQRICIHDHITLQPAGTRAGVQGVPTTKNGIGICAQLLSGSLMLYSDLQIALSGLFILHAECWDILL